MKISNIIKKLSDSTLYELFGLIKIIYLRLKARYLYSLFMQSVGAKSYIDKPILLAGLKYITIGSNVIIFKNCRIEILDAYGDSRFKPEFRIGDYSQIHQNAHITCANSIIIGNNVVITSNVTITDINHLYEDIDTPINWQKIEVKPVSIGDQSYLYNNSVILPGVAIGRHCIVAANSVVANNVPDNTLVAGSPAIAIKRYNTISGQWEKVARQ
ncbi:putative lipopolysaccharide biosynthesis O-acetyl transferase WbbJ [Geobacter sp. OR-1]|uniref:acyltransferase n=1 Tax=Geobacter sp. OR-1 TaxID=1266765 RepID=UPI000543440B|nr:acyltransferase [Geobacter sp. OR-1]GAM08241.1 putative lipopolysaccharide biosynthesis O-acetyl transferase WbbJ [Geobacter sp. OR-1]